MENDVLLKVQNLVVHYETHNAVVEAVNNVSFEIRSGQTLGLVGETGAGKTTIALAIMSLLPKYTGKVIQGSIEFDGRDLRQLSPKEMRSIRGHDISMIFQDPMSSLNPVLPVDEQISELIRLHRRCSRAKAAIEAREILKKVGIQPERAGEYPHQFSGGMKQRILVAQAILGDPSLIILDEPTVGLDPRQILEIRDLIRSLRDDHVVLLSSHVLSEVSAVCDYIFILSHGRLVASDTPENLEAQLHAGGALCVSVRATPQEMHLLCDAMLPGIPVEIGAGARAGQTELRFGSVDDTVTEKLFYACAAAKRPILKMEREKASLEEIFLELTDDDHAGPAEQEDDLREEADA